MSKRAAARIGETQRERGVETEGKEGRGVGRGRKRAEREREFHRSDSF